MIEAGRIGSVHLVFSCALPAFLCDTFRVINHPVCLGLSDWKTKSPVQETSQFQANWCSLSPHILEITFILKIRYKLLKKIKYFNISDLFSVTQHVFILKKTVYEVCIKNYFKPVLESVLVQRKKLLFYNRDVQYNHMVFFF